ncbi:MAG: PcfJ domain-containing protein [Treponema sp.]|nr:PcfJ domain-containing protein [Treponema sp.]
MTTAEWILWANCQKGRYDYELSGDDWAKIRAWAARFQTFQFSIAAFAEGAGIVELVYSYKTTKRRGVGITLCAAFAENAELPPLCRNLVMRNFGGLVAYGHYGKGSRWYGYEENLDEACDDLSKRLYRFPLVTSGRLASLDKTLLYCGYSADFTDVCEYVRRYRNNPALEMLGKLGLTTFSDKALTFLAESKQFRKYVFRYAEDIKRCGISGAWVLPAFRKNIDPLSYYTDRLSKVKCEKTWHNIPEAVRTDFPDGTTPLMVQKWLDSATDRNLWSANDYWRACKGLRMSLKNSRVAFPKDFRRAHDEYTRLYSAHKDELVDEGMLETAVHYAELSGVKKSGFVFMVACDTGELIAEGNALGHCVGRMGYNAKQAEGNSLILFARKQDAVGVPFCTIELSLPTLTIKQCYGFHNRLEPEVRKATEYVIQAYKKKHRVPDAA